VGGELGVPANVDPGCLGDGCERSVRATGRKTPAAAVQEDGRRPRGSGPAKPFLQPRFKRGAQHGVEGNFSIPAALAVADHQMTLPRRHAKVAQVEGDRLADP